MPWSWPLANLRRRAYEEGVAAGRRLAQEQLRGDREMALAWHVGRPLICIPNEWDNPLVGFGRRLVKVGSSSVLEAHDELSNQDLVCGGICVDYSRQRLEAVLALDPYQAWSLLSHRATSMNARAFADYDKPMTGTRASRDEIMARLEASGFFARAAEFTGRG